MAVVLPARGESPKVRLGRYLFYDKRLSANGTQSCGTCHRQELAFTDGKAVAVGSTGQAHTRSAMSLVNLAYSKRLTWADPSLRSLEEQALVPMFSEKPVELGLVKSVFVATLRSDEIYRPLFPAVFPGERDPYTIANVTKALAAFERTIVSRHSAYDRFHYGGDENAISDSAKRGEVVFFTDPLGGCYRCHSGFNFSDGEYHNTGLYNPSGKFKTPTLRNVAVTAPYMHDGSVATLEDVLDHYVAGGRAGNDNPGKDKLIRKLALTRQNREDLLAFLRSLTDEELLRDPKYADPW